MTDVNLWLAIAGALISAVVGLLSGVAVAGWWLGIKNSEHLQVISDVKDIKSGCTNQHTELMRQMKDAVCSGFKLAIKELGSDFDAKLAKRDDKISGIDKASAILNERMRQAELDIEAIFGILNSRDVDTGGPAGELRSARDRIDKTVVL